MRCITSSGLQKNQKNKCMHNKILYRRHFFMLAAHSKLNKQGPLDSWPKPSYRRNRKTTIPEAYLSGQINQQYIKPVLCIGAVMLLQYRHRIHLTWAMMKCLASSFSILSCSTSYFYTNIIVYNN